MVVAHRIYARQSSRGYVECGGLCLCMRSQLTESVSCLRARHAPPHLGSPYHAIAPRSVRAAPRLPGLAKPCLVSSRSVLSRLTTPLARSVAPSRLLVVPLCAARFIFCPVSSYQTQLNLTLSLTTSHFPFSPLLLYSSHIYIYTCLQILKLNFIACNPKFI